MVRRNGYENPQNDAETFAYLGKVRYLKEASEKLAGTASFTSKYDIVKKWGPLNLAIIEYPDPEQGTLDKKAYCERRSAVSWVACRARAIRSTRASSTSCCMAPIRSLRWNCAALRR